MNLETVYKEEPQKTFWDLQSENYGTDKKLTDSELDEIYNTLERDNEERINKILNDPKERDKLFPDDDEQRDLQIGPYEELFDPGIGKWSIAKDIEKFYGKEYLARVRKELEDNLWDRSDRPIGEYSKQLYHEMKCMRAGTKPTKVKSKTPEDKPEISLPKKKNAVKESQIEQKEKKSGDDYFLKTFRGVIRNPGYRKIFCGPGTIYDWLWAYLARKDWKDTAEYPLKKNYYDNGLLACTMSFRFIAENCGMNKNTVQKHIDAFKDAGIIKIDYWIPDGKKRGQNIYILGEWTILKVDGKDKIHETYYRDQVFLSD